MRFLTAEMLKETRAVAGLVADLHCGRGRLRLAVPIR
jgi:hypothetical protein